MSNTLPEAKEVAQAIEKLCVGKQPPTLENAIAVLVSVYGARVLRWAAERCKEKADIKFAELERTCTNTDGCDEHDHESGECNALWAMARELDDLASSIEASGVKR